MDCRPGCAACCIAPSIASPLPGMPDGKPAGVRCVNLDDAGLCGLWGKPNYPPVCAAFKPQRWVCGETASEAMALISELEARTRPDGL
ncbi:YkgJ family cysteine cluster protein [bacterium]|nr:MAG: YkgJ family cysteine cluster protein [bacterium]